MDALTRIRAVVVAAQVRILPVVGGAILGGLDAQPPAAVGADRQALEQVDPGGFLVGLDGHPPAGAHRLAAIPQLLGDDRLVLALRELGRRGAVADAFGPDAHAPVADLADEVGITEHIPDRVFVERPAFGGEIALLVQPGGDLHVRIQPGGIALEHRHHDWSFFGSGTPTLRLPCSSLM